MNDRELLRLAQEASTRAYAPYSNFPVGAALECEDGTVFLGCNVENAAFGECICAERTAVVKAVSEGYTKFRRIAVYGTGKNYCMPCGACRQVLSEFSPDMEVLASKEGGGYVSYPLNKLLAYSFKL
ncbi:MAG: cytidine deaminase [Oscillospiraceae bacterium]|nr:cytidine deaminase [Oscillospiraceae bacterium]